MNRDKILMQSLKLIRKNGLENFSMRRLAEVLEIKTASIYYYFKTKDDILNGIFQKSIQTFWDLDRKKFNSLDEYLYWLYKTVQKHRDLFMFMARYRNNNFLSQESKKLMEQYNENLKKTLESYDEGVMFSPVNRNIVKGSIIEIVHNHDKEPKLSDDQIKLLVRKIMKALKEE